MLAQGSYRHVGDDAADVDDISLGLLQVRNGELRENNYAENLKFLGNFRKFSFCKFFKNRIFRKIKGRLSILKFLLFSILLIFINLF